MSDSLTDVKALPPRELLHQGHVYIRRDIALQRYSHWTCKTHGDFDARVAVGCPECVRALREDLQRTVSAHAVVMAENTHYKQRAADLERKFSPRRWGKAESDAWNRAIPDVNKAFADLLAAQQTPWLPETTPEAVTVQVPVDWSKAVPINLRYPGQDRTSETTGDVAK